MNKNSVKQAFTELDKKLDNLKNGGINCIPNPIKSLRQNIPGIEKDHIYLVTAASGCGKSMLTCYIFVFNAVLYAFTHRKQCDVNINYFALEESSSELVYKFASFLCELGRQEDKNLPRITVNKFRARTIDSAITDEEYSYVREKYKDILDYFESRVHISDLNEIDDIEPYFSKVAEENGKMNNYGYYEPNNSKMYNIIIYDHVGLLPLTKGRDLRTTIAEVCKISKNLRIKYGYTTVFTQQQNADTQNLDAVKNNHIEPSKAGLADCKDTDRIALTSIGITCPYIYKKDSYYGYRITPEEEGNSHGLFSTGRFINVLKCRYGAFNLGKGLLLDGATGVFYELPPADSNEMQDFYNKASELISLDFNNELNKK